MHIALACPELSGHLNPMTTLGRELMRRGHRVTVVARPDGESKAVAAGLQFAAIGAAEFPRGAIAAQAAALGGMTAGKALRYTIDMMRLAAERRGLRGDRPARKLRRAEGREAQTGPDGEAKAVAAERRHRVQVPGQFGTGEADVHAVVFRRAVRARGGVRRAATCGASPGAGA